MAKPRFTEALYLKISPEMKQALGLIPRNEKSDFVRDAILDSIKTKPYFKLFKKEEERILFEKLNNQ